MLISHLIEEDLSLIRLAFKGDMNRSSNIRNYGYFIKSGFAGVHDLENKYEFFTFTRSQLETRDCLLIKKGERHHVMSRLGFDDVHEVAKVVKYSGLLMNELDVEVQVLVDVNVVMEKDIVRRGYNFSDGCGRISRDLVVQLVSDAAYVPSVLQIRAPGIKGVLMLDPQLGHRTIVFRGSMQKLNILTQVVEGRSVVVEKLPIAVLHYSMPQRCRGLNMQVISLLLERGLPSEIIRQKDRDYKNAVNHALVDIRAAFDFLFICGYDKDLEFLIQILHLRYSQRRALSRFWNDLKNLQSSQIATWRKGNWKANRTRDRNASSSSTSSSSSAAAPVTSQASLDREDLDPPKRMVLPLRESDLLFGVCDHRGILKPGQCFVQILRPNAKSQVLTGKIAAMRNPCYHPGDIVVLEAVDVEAFHYVQNAIVFCTTGDRPDADVCSGGDLDGDRFLIVWDKDIISRLKPAKPFNYRPAAVETCIVESIKKLGIHVDNAGSSSSAGQKRSGDVLGRRGVSKRDLIDYFISYGSKDTIVGKIDGLLLQFQKSEFKKSANALLSRDELMNLLTSLFAASVDSMNIDFDVMVTAVWAEMIKNQTAQISDWKKLYAFCIENTHDTAAFTKRYQTNLLFRDFEASTQTPEVAEWRQPNFLSKFVPCKNTNYGNLTALIMNAGKRFQRKEMPSLCGAFEKLQHRLDPDVFMACFQEISALEALISDCLKACEVDEMTAVECSEDVFIYEKCHNNQLEFENLFNLHSSFGNVANSVCNLMESLDGVSITTKVNTVLFNELEMLKTRLPIYSSRNELMDCIRDNRVVLIISETGSGKSTCTPNFVTNELFFEGKLSPAKQVIVAQPRRNATTSLAQRLAESRGSRVGNEVGYHIGRMPPHVTADRTVIRCVTYGILVLYAQSDPSFRDFSVIILDEVHESSCDLHFLFSILKKALTMNAELKIILMSASVNIKNITSFFEKCELVVVEGRSFPVEEEYIGNLSTQSDVFITNAIHKCIDIHETEPLGDNPDILIFLPTKKDIDEAVFRLRVKTPVPNLHVFPLHSRMREEKKRFILNRSPLHQWEALNRSDQNSGDYVIADNTVEDFDLVDWEINQGNLQQKVKKEVVVGRGERERRAIFCTNIAETSLTIPCIGYVIDSGLQFTVDISPVMKIRHCKLQQETQTSAVQRKGRAGRLGPGKCFRLYSQDDLDSFPDEYPVSPKSFEIHLLQIVKMFGDYLTYNWFKRPHDSEVGWAWTILQESKFAEFDEYECKQTVSPDGLLAIELNRRDVPGDIALFLLRVWRDGDANEKIRELCATIAAFLSFGTASIFDDGFKYSNFVNAGEHEEFKSVDGSPLPSSFCKANLFLVWQQRNEDEEKKEFCKKMKLFWHGMKSINEIREDILWIMNERAVDENMRKAMDLVAPELQAEERHNFILGHLASACFASMGMVTEHGDFVAFMMNDDRSEAKLDPTEAHMFGSKSHCKVC
ncbi:UNVERIFIED_CONTAM: putative ATP-dependent RNA helicase dhr2 [Siphonaria sp. JEL0065]|nr:putative ATP-dependent RNA helicase dhr2 [Siphonaria sp. JEL0065]